MAGGGGGGGIHPPIMAKAEHHHQRYVADASLGPGALSWGSEPAPNQIVLGWVLETCPDGPAMWPSTATSVSMVVVLLGTRW